MDRTYYYSIDFVKFFCAVAVVAIHVTAKIPGNDINTFWNYDLYRPFLNVAVPFFFISSGFFLSEKYNIVNKLDVFYKYMGKIFFYLVIFTLLYIAVRLSLEIFNAFYFRESIKDAIHNYLDTFTYQSILNGSIGSFHLYFLANLIYTSGIVAAFIRFNVDSKFMMIIASIAYLFTRSGLMEIPTLFIYEDIFKGFLYVSMGYFLSQYSDSIKRLKYPLFYFFLFGLFYFLAIQVTNYPLRGVFLPLMCFYLAVFCVKNQNFGKKSFITKLSKHSLGVYILHVLVLLIVNDIYSYIGFDEFYAWIPYYPISIFLCTIIPIFIFEPIYNAMNKLIKLVI